MKIPNAKPFFPDDDIDSILCEIKNSLKSGILTLGPNVVKLEKEFEYCSINADESVITMRPLLFPDILFFLIAKLVIYLQF